MSTSTPEYYTLDELRQLGCPNELLMQYVFMPKSWIDDMLKKASLPIETFSETSCKDCGAKTTPGPGSARCGQCWDDRCGN